jgi:dolichol kinase
MSPGFIQEAKRKLFHSFSFLYALLFVLTGRDTSLWVLGVMVVLASLVEAARLRNPALNERLLRSFKGIHREKEVHKPSGILWTLMGCFLTILLVPHRDIVLASLLYLAVGDGVAGLIGRNWGHLRIGSKSLEGSLSCFLACWVVGEILLSPLFGSYEVILGAVAATILEALPLPLNDNLWMPLISGLFLTVLRAVV